MTLGQRLTNIQIKIVKIVRAGPRLRLQKYLSPVPFQPYHNL